MTWEELKKYAEEKGIAEKCSFTNTIVMYLKDGAIIEFFSNGLITVKKTGKDFDSFFHLCKKRNATQMHLIMRGLE